MTELPRFLTSRPLPAPRFDRERWLEAALEVLAREGQAKLEVVHLAAQLGVTKGSFYHHFKNRDDFVRSLTAYWSDVFTEWVKGEVASSGLGASERITAREIVRERRRDFRRRIVAGPRFAQGGGEKSRVAAAVVPTHTMGEERICQALRGHREEFR